MCFHYIGGSGVPLASLIAGEAGAFGSRRVTIAGPDEMIGARQVQPIALVVQELLANAAKHAALSSETGQVDVSWSRKSDHLKICWRETGGPPPVEERPRHLGTRLIEQTIERQLNGRATFDWQRRDLPRN